MVHIKRIIGLLVFLVGLAVIIIALSFVFIPKNNTKEAGIEENVANGILSEPKDSIDVLFFGDSEVFAAVSPLRIWAKTGYTTYVCGSVSQKLSYTQTLLERSLKNQSPKIVVMETLAIYRNLKIDESMYEKACNILPFFRYHDRWKNLHPNDFGGDINYTKVEESKGYSYNVSIASSTATDYMKPSNTVAPVSWLNERYVRKIKEICEDNGAQLILLSSPSTINWNSERHNGMEAFAKKIGCEYIDLNTMNDKINIDWSTDTRDKGDHMNYDGAAKVSDFLAAYLKDKNILTDHRNDENYSSWNALLKKYEAHVKHSQS